MKTIALIFSLALAFAIHNTVMAHEIFKVIAGGK